MQIKSFSINDHLCLVDFHIDFQTIPRGARNGGSTTILIGENGTGKSTMMETIMEILLSFDSPAREEEIEYDYRLEYDYAQKEITIEKKANKYQITVDGHVIAGSFDTVRKKIKKISIFPSRIITFYSGANNKMLDRVEFLNRVHRIHCKKIVELYVKSLRDPSATFSRQLPKRKYNYCDEAFVPIYLSAILAGHESYEKRYLQTECRFRNIEFIDMEINMDRLAWLFDVPTFKDEDLTNLYIISDFIDKRFTPLLKNGFQYGEGNKGYFEIEGLEELGVDSISILEYFEKMQSLLYAKFEVTVAYGESQVESSQMSEGQRQLIKILGMLGICKSEDCLVLMDEPDAHMNPKWKYELYPIIQSSLEKAINTQALMATHDPLVINGVSKEFIRIFTHTSSKKTDGFYQTKVVIPTEDTEGLGIDGLLQSEYYGMPSVLDHDTRNKMDKRNDLLVKRKDGTITEDESQALIELTNDLENMAFARNIPTDSYYDEYVAAMHRIYSERPKASLTAEDIAERNAKAEEILRGLLNK